MFQPYIMELVEKWLTRNEVEIPKVSLSSKINSDGDDVEVRSDPATSSLQVIDHAHHKRHLGDAFFLDDVQDMTINHVYDLRIVTPNTTEWSHFTFFISAEAETEWYFYENVSIDVTSTPAPPFNVNRNSAETASMQIQPITNTSLALANADTDVSGATALLNGIVGGGLETSNRGHSFEIILKQNEDYCLRMIANAAGYVKYNLDWYEHADHN